MKNYLSKGVALLIISCLVWGDWKLKYWVVHHIPLVQDAPYFYPYNGIAIFHDFLGVEFSLNQLHNYGAAWGLFHDYTQWLSAFRVFIFCGMLGYFLWTRLFFLESLAWILILSGALGNIIDYFVYGYVVDMFHFIFWGYDYPIFNLADSYVCCGVVIWIITSYLKEKRSKVSL